MKFINEELIHEGKTEELRARFLSGKPYRYLVIEDFLQMNVVMGVFDALKKERFEHKESDLFSFSQTEDFANVKVLDKPCTSVRGHFDHPKVPNAGAGLFDIERGVLKEFYEFMKSNEFISWIEKVSGIKLTRGKIDMSGSLYSSCDYLLCHDDLIGKRKIAFVFYLSSLDSEDGGDFVMYDEVDGKVGKMIKKILPRFNSFLMFEVSEKSFHSVEEVLRGKRYAIGGWFYV